MLPNRIRSTVILCIALLMVLGFGSRVSGGSGNTSDGVCSIGGEVRGVSQGDFDGDQSIEVVVGTALEGFLCMFRPILGGDSGVELKLICKSAFGSFLVGPAAGDLDGDGLPEIVAVDNVNQLWILGFDGRNVLAKADPVQLSEPAIHVGVVDVVGYPGAFCRGLPGGKTPAAAVVTADGLSLYALSGKALTGMPGLGPAAGEIKALAYIPLSFLALSCSTGDVDGDGARDLLLGGLGGQLKVFGFRDHMGNVSLAVKADCVPPWESPEPSAGSRLAPGVLSVRPIDVDGDGKLEVAAGYGDGHITLYTPGEPSVPLSWERIRFPGAVLAVTASRGLIAVGGPSGVYCLRVDREGRDGLAPLATPQAIATEYCTELVAIELGTARLILAGFTDGVRIYRD